MLQDNSEEPVWDGAHASSHTVAKLTKRTFQMITLNRLGHTDEPFQLNPDLIVTIESTPDTVLTLATTAKVVVSETPEEVAAAIRAFRVEVLSEALRNRRPEREPALPRTLHP
ncbi:MAG TPA: flagellar FlbD family protein [Solirubrobacteraceae bacterium]|nr:flagellar FlbD family protein [Solirubrobacteraceae bacterium]